MFGMSNVPNTPRNRIAALIAIVLGLGVGFYIAVSGGKDDTPPADETYTTSTPTANSTSTPPPSAPMPPKSLKLEDIDYNSYSKDLAKFTGLKEGQSRGEAVDNVRLYFAPEDGSVIIQTSQSSFDLPDGSVLLFSAAGLPDDSVKAEEIYLILSGPKEAQTLAAYGARIKCHRGANTTEWQRELCP